MKQFLAGRCLARLYHAFSVIQRDLYILLLPALLLPATGAKAVEVRWLTRSGTNDWSQGTNWSSDPNPPAAGDDVIITNTSAGTGFGVLLTSSVGYFSSVLLSNRCTLIFSNWDTSLSATNVSIMINSTMTLPAAFTDSQQSNNVYLSLF